MTAQKGLNMLLRLGTVASPTTVAGLKDVSLKLSNDLVDVTTKDSAGFRTLLAQAGTQSLQISANGVAESATSFETLQNYAFAASINTLNLIFGDGDTVEGSFQVSDFQVTGPHNDAQTFSLTLESSGAWTFVAA